MNILWILEIIFFPDTFYLRVYMKTTTKSGLRPVDLLIAFRAPFRIPPSPFRAMLVVLRT